MNPTEIFKCLSDNSRLRIVNSLMIEAMYVELLAERLDLSKSTVCFHLKKLMEAKIVSSQKEQYYTIYSLNEDVFQLTLGELVQAGCLGDHLPAQREDEYREQVIASCFKAGKLQCLPVQKMKRRIVLEKIAESFDKGRTYTEKEVNLIIADFHDDFCTIRKDLVEFSLLARKSGVYERVSPLAAQ